MNEISFNLNNLTFSTKTMFLRSLLIKKDIFKKAGLENFMSFSSNEIT